jgi:iron(III) transport system ATP-binding protein
VSPPDSGLVVRGVRASHGRTAVLHGIDLHVPDETLACIVGPSGCGKTTLLRVIAGFHRPSAGRVELAGRTLDDPPALQLAADRRKVGYIPQDIALFPHLTVAGNVGFGLARGRRGPRAAKIRDLLELVDLSEYANRHPHQLSGGQQQRIALARALAPGPDLLLLDEPFSALDAGLRDRVRDEVASLLRRTRTTAILVTHDAHEALAFADLVSIIDEGRVTQTGTPEQLYTQPVNGSVARALGAVNLLPATADGPLAVTALGPLETTGALPPVAQGGPFTVLVRPRQLTVDPGPPGPADTVGRVVACEFRGDEHQLDIAVTGLASPLLAQCLQHIEPGTRVRVAVGGPVHPLLEDRPRSAARPEAEQLS